MRNVIIFGLTLANSLGCESAECGEPPTLAGDVAVCASYPALFVELDDGSSPLQDCLPSRYGYSEDCVFTASQDNEVRITFHNSSHRGGALSLTAVVGPEAELEPPLADVSIAAKSQVSTTLSIAPEISLVLVDVTTDLYAPSDAFPLTINVTDSSE
jgi:hypothetical protein